MRCHHWRSQVSEEWILRTSQVFYRKWSKAVKLSPKAKLPRAIPKCLLLQPFQWQIPVTRWCSWRSVMNIHREEFREWNVPNVTWSLDHPSPLEVTWPWCIQGTPARPWNARNAIGITSIRKLWKSIWKKSTLIMTSSAFTVSQASPTQGLLEERATPVGTSRIVAKSATTLPQPKETWASICSLTSIWIMYRS